MKSKIYQGALAGMIGWPVGAVALIIFLNPTNTSFPILLKVFFLFIALFSFSLNYVVDYQQDNSRITQLLIRYTGILPFVILLPFRSHELILHPPYLVWFVFLLSVYVTLFNHFGGFRINRQVFLSKMGALISLLSFLLGLHAITTGNSTGFTLWFISIVLVILAAIGQVFHKKKPKLN
jgi:hypothetical protein